jgi:Spherulation-specific family 4
MSAQIAIAAYNPSTFKNPAIPDAGSTVRYAVLENSIANFPGDSEYHTWIAAMKAAGQLVFGYVPVNNGACTGSEVKNGWTPPNTPFQYGVQTWRTNFPELSGIYLDEGPTDNGTKIQPNGQNTTQNYTDYYTLVKQFSGWSVLVEASMYPNPWIDQVSDYLIIWEGDLTIYKNDNTYGWSLGSQTGPPPGWWNNPAKMVHQVRGASGSDLPTIFVKAAQRGAGAVYVPDRGGVGFMPLQFPFQQALAGRTFALGSVQFPNVCLRMDGRGVTSPNGSGAGTVNCQFGAGPWEEFRLELQPDASLNIASVQFPNVCLRMDGRGVTSPNGSGAGTVNCQFGAGPWEKFSLQVSPDDTLNIASVQFPNVCLRMDGRGVTSPNGSGAGTVNCQFGAGPWEEFTILPL